MFHNNESIFISWEIIKFAFKKHRKALFRNSCCTALLVLIVLIFRTPVYQAEATFRQSASRSDDMKGLKGLFTNLQLGSEDYDAIPFMLSRHLLLQVISETGLQMESSPDGWLTRLKHNALRNLLRECGFFCLAPEPFVFRKVAFSQELEERFFLVFKNSKQFELFDNTHAFLASAEIGKHLETTNLSFTLEHIPSHIEIGKSYSVKILPPTEAMHKVMKNLQIKPLKINSRILSLAFKHPDRKTCALFLDKLMHRYQQQLKEENDQAAAEQLHFLDKRHDLLAKELNSCLQDYAHYLKKNLREHGLVGLSEHLELTAIPLETQYIERLSQIALEKQSFLSKEKYSFQLTANTESLRDFHGMNKEAASDLYIKYNEELEENQLHINQLSHFIDRIGQDTFELSALSGFLRDPISQDLIRSASEIRLTLHDHENRSEKEQGRLRELLQKKKNFLQEHLNERLELEKLNLQVLKQKIISLRITIQHLLQKEERQILSQLHLFREQMSDFPDKWQLENTLEFKKNMTMRVMEAMSQLSETKTIQNLLFQVESKPLDTAYAPIKPKFPFLLFFSLSAFCLTLFALLAFRLLKPAGKIHNEKKMH